MTVNGAKTERLFSWPQCLVAALQRLGLICSYGLCAYCEIVGIPLTQDEVATLVSSPPTGMLKFGLKAENGLDGDDEMAVAEIAGAYQKVTEYRNAMTAE